MLASFSKEIIEEKVVRNHSIVRPMSGCRTYSFYFESEWLIGARSTFYGKARITLGLIVRQAFNLRPLA